MTDLHNELLGEFCVAADLLVNAGSRQPFLEELLMNHIPTTTDEGLRMLQRDGIGLLETLPSLLDDAIRAALAGGPISDAALIVTSMMVARQVRDGYPLLLYKLQEGDGMFDQVLEAMHRTTEMLMSILSISFEEGTKQLPPAMYRQCRTAFVRAALNCAAVPEEFLIDKLSALPPSLEKAKILAEFFDGLTEERAGGDMPQKRSMTRIRVRSSMDAVLQDLSDGSICSPHDAMLPLAAILEVATYLSVEDPQDSCPAFWAHLASSPPFSAAIETLCQTEGYDPEGQRTALRVVTSACSALTTLKCGGAAVSLRVLRDLVPNCGMDIVVEALGAIIEGVGKLLLIESNSEEIGAARDALLKAAHAAADVLDPQTDVGWEASKDSIEAAVSFLLQLARSLIPPAMPPIESDDDEDDIITRSCEVDEERRECCEAMAGGAGDVLMRAGRAAVARLWALGEMNDRDSAADIISFVRTLTAHQTEPWAALRGRRAAMAMAARSLFGGPPPGASGAPEPSVHPAFTLDFDSASASLHCLIESIRSMSSALEFQPMGDLCDEVLSASSAGGLGNAGFWIAILALQMEGPAVGNAWSRLMDASLGDLGPLEDATVAAAVGNAAISFERRVHRSPGAPYDDIAADPAALAQFVGTVLGKPNHPACIGLLCLAEGLAAQLVASDGDLCDLAIHLSNTVSEHLGDIAAAAHDDPLHGTSVLDRALRVVLTACGRPDVDCPDPFVPGTPLMNAAQDLAEQYFSSDSIGVGCCMMVLVTAAAGWGSVPNTIVALLPSALVASSVAAKEPALYPPHPAVPLWDSTASALRGYNTSLAGGADDFVEALSQWLSEGNWPPNVAAAVVSRAVDVTNCDTLYGSLIAGLERTPITHQHATNIVLLFVGSSSITILQVLSSNILRLIEEVILALMDGSASQLVDGPSAALSAACCRCFETLLVTKAHDRSGTDVTQIYAPLRAVMALAVEEVNRCSSEELRDDSTVVADVIRGVASLLITSTDMHMNMLTDAIVTAVLDGCGLFDGAAEEPRRRLVEVGDRRDAVDAVRSILRQCHLAL